MYENSVMRVISMVELDVFKELLYSCCRDTTHAMRPDPEQSTDPDDQNEWSY